MGVVSESSPCGFPGATSLSDHPVDIGQRTEAIVLAELVKRGYRVLLPFGTNHRYDFVLDLDDRFLRIQCKTGRLRRGAIIFNARSTRSNTRGSVPRPYLDEIDAFVVFCPETGRVYAVPIEDATSTIGTLRVAPSANSQVRRIRWAADYELPA
jgi:hypothetical protein